MKNIVCMKWGNRYSPEYVTNLYRMCKRHMNQEEFRFVCFTDDSNGIDTNNIETFPLPDASLHSWWRKLGYFKFPLFDLEGPILSLDLDMIILNDISQLFKEHHTVKDFHIMKDFFPQNLYNSSIMLFESGSQCTIYNEFLQDLDNKGNQTVSLKRGTKTFDGHVDSEGEEYWGDQMWISKKAKKISTWSEDKKWFKTWKFDLKGNSKNVDYKNTKIIIFTGTPNPHQLSDKKLLNLWYGE